MDVFSPSIRPFSLNPSLSTLSSPFDSSYYTRSDSLTEDQRQKLEMFRELADRAAGTAEPVWSVVFDPLHVELYRLVMHGGAGECVCAPDTQSSTHTQTHTVAPQMNSGEDCTQEAKQLNRLRRDCKSTVRRRDGVGARVGTRCHTAQSRAVRAVRLSLALLDNGTVQRIRRVLAFIGLAGDEAEVRLSEKVCNKLWNV